MTYRAPVTEMRFLLEHVLGAGRLAETERFAEATPETIEAILGEAAKLAEDVPAPLRRAGDLEGARLENGVVRATPGFGAAYRTLAEGGWVGIAADPEHGGMGLPVILLTCLNEMCSGANMALSLCPLLTQGQIEALEHHAPDDVKARFLPKLVAGDWTGTMNLTEPQAGSDVGAVRTRAEPKGDGTYAVSGQKIFISWGDHDIAENVCHLVLARLPDGAAGTRGISLFLVPKFLAMDMVGRKLMDGGAAAQALIAEVEETARQVAGELGARLAAAGQRLAETTGWMAAAEMNDRFAGAAPYLRAFALTLGGHYLLKAAEAEGADGPRAALAAFQVRQLLPQVGALCDAACEGAAALYALDLAS